MTTHHGAVGDAERRVILFRPRARAAARANNSHRGGPHELSSPALDLARFEQPRERDNYRHRMIVNTLALAFTACLAIAGIWIAESMAVMRRNQDCVLVGRRNCATIDIPVRDRRSDVPVSDRSVSDHGERHIRQP